MDTRTFICDGKYSIVGLHGNTIGMSVDLPDLPETIKVDGLTLRRKTSFHVSLFPTAKIAEKHQIEIPEFLEKVTADLCEFVKEYPVEFSGFQEEFRFVAENERRSVVRMCSISNIDKFYDLINGKYGLKIGYPPTHVTLYTLQPDAGIYLIDAEDMESLSKPIENPGTPA